ncbi:MAG TPA: hypothetical protein VMW53_07665 [archaeon]|nr:hypothetical protein [archaeon]
MRYLNILLAIVFTGLILTGGCITAPESSADITWIGTPPDDRKVIESKMATMISPYQGAVYENVTASASKENDRINIHVTGSISSSQYPDLYDFTYHNKELVQVGYLLEAVPDSIRNEAINVALRNEDVKAALGSGMTGIPSVKRILPETAANYYVPKTLISVTWIQQPVSALVDMDTRSVVRVWNGEAQATAYLH